MTQTISEAIKKRNVLFLKAKRTGKQSDRENFNIQRNQVVVLLWKSKQSFFNRFNDAFGKQ